MPWLESEPTPDPARPLYVAVDDPARRLRAGHVVNTVYAGNAILPQDSFVPIGDDIAISSPELLFAELGAEIDFVHLVLLGHELCGTFSRDPENPRNGDAVFDVEPVTSPLLISEFLEQARGLRGVQRARAALRCVSGNAWSPMEAVISAMINMPTSELGYGLDRCALNRRVSPGRALASSFGIGNRVPDILFAGTRVGLNYDGQEHLDLRSIADAAVECERDRDRAASSAKLQAAMAAVRTKAIDDLRRNRELAASGFIVLPVTKEDLYDYGGLDRVIAEAFEIVKLFGDDDSDPGEVPGLTPALRPRRMQLLRSLLP